MSSPAVLEESFNSAALLAGQNRLLGMIASAVPLGEVLTSLTQLIESQSEGLLCSILLLGKDGRLTHGAAPSLPAAYTSAIDGTFIGPKVGSCGTAAYFRMPVIVADILEDPLWDDYRALAITHGLRACWSTPFYSSQGQVLGTFAMYYRTPRVPGSADAQIIDTATRIASIAVEHSQSDLRLRQAAETVRALVANLNDIVFSLDVEGRVFYISPRIEALLGYGASDVIGQPFSQFVHRDDRAALQQSFADALTGNPQTGEFRFIHKNGGVYSCRVSSRPQFQHSQAVGVTGVVVDITEQRAAMDALQKAEQKYRTFFEEAIVGIFQSDPAGQLVTVNPALAEMLGYD